MSKEKEKHSFELISGAPIKVGGICSVHPLKIGEIGRAGYGYYQQVLSLLTMNKDDFLDGKNLDKDDIDVFDIIAATSSQQADFRVAIEQGLALFLKEPVTFYKDGAVFVVGTIENVKDNSKELRFIDRSNYNSIVDIIRVQNLIVSRENEEKKPVYASEKARLLAEKRDKGREKLSEMRGGGITIEGLISMAGVFTQDLGEVMGWTVYQLHDQCDAFMRREEYDSKFGQLLAGADPKKLKLDKHWSTK